MPIAALTHDVIYNARSATEHRGLGFGALELGRSAIINSALYAASYYALRTVGPVSLYALYTLSKTAQDSPGLLETAKSTFRNPRETVSAACQQAAERPLETARNILLSTAMFGGRLAVNAVKGLCGLVVNASVVRHLAAGTRGYNWVNSITTPTATTTAADNPPTAPIDNSIIQVVIDDPYPAPIGNNSPPPTSTEQLAASGVFGGVSGDNVAAAVSSARAAPDGGGSGLADKSPNSATQITIPPRAAPTAAGGSPSAHAARAKRTPRAAQSGGGVGAADGGTSVSIGEHASKVLTVTRHNLAGGRRA
jgi:hypothetical protein